MITEKIFNEFWDKNNDNYKGLCKVIDIVREQIDPNEFDIDETPSIQITISVNKECTTWAFQSGDNSYTGSCYGDPYWGVSYMTQDKKSDSAVSIADFLINDLADQIEFTE